MRKSFKLESRFLACLKGIVATKKYFHVRFKNIYIYTESTKMANKKMTKFYFIFYNLRLKAKMFTLVL